MRVISSLLVLVVVLLIISLLAKKQMQAIESSVPASVTAGASQPGSHPPVPEQVRNVEQTFRDDTARALQQGVERNERAVP